MSRIPPDRSQCQALRPNLTWSPFNLGPADEDPQTGEKRGGSRQVDRYWRCREAPVCIVEERELGKDGEKGQMSLCLNCFVALFAQEPTLAVLVEKLEG